MAMPGASRTERAPVPSETADVQGAPAVPDSIEDTGLSETFVSDLLLKTLYERGGVLGRELARAVCLPYKVLDDEILKLQHRQLIEVRGTEGRARSVYTYDLTGEGRHRSRELLASSPYVGPVPVPFDRYCAWVEAQSVRDVHLSRQEIFEGFSHLVLPEKFVDRLGPAINSGESLFLFGHSGNGKTAIAEAIAAMFGDAIFVPRAVKAGGRIVQVFDPAVHEPVEDDDEGEDAPINSDLLHQRRRYDQRFVRVKRPTVIVGGELTLDQLELQRDAETGVFRAPPQMKANGGVFVVDDFGRQKVQPRSLLNRWIYPLEKGVDFLGLPTGQKLVVPFENLLIFATNLNPVDLVEEAFLRRIRYKLLVDDPTAEQYTEIFRRFASRHGLAFGEDAVRFVHENFYEPLGRPPRSCHPRDLVKHLLDVAAYRGEEPSLSEELLGEAGETYFMDLPASMFDGSDSAEEAEPEEYGIGG